MLLLVDVSGYLSQVQYILSPLFGIGPYASSGFDRDPWGGAPSGSGSDIQVVGSLQPRK